MSLVNNSMSVANRNGVECPLVDKLNNSNTHDVVEVDLDHMEYQTVNQRKAASHMCLKWEHC